ncbi:MAG: transposase [Bacteroidetes bacterium]|nr:transposase [Bacteroidota bacterium]
MTMTNDEFTRRFSLHILPQRFVRIRHYGILSSSWKRGKLQQLQQVLNVKKYSATPIINHRRCPYCKTGTLITIEVFGSRGPPAMYLSASPQTSMV